MVGDEAGITLFLRSIEVGGPRREPYRYLARCYLALGKFTEAGEAVKCAIATSPDDAVAVDPAVQSRSEPVTDACTCRLLNEGERARDAFVRARDLDTTPWRAPALRSPSHCSREGIMTEAMLQDGTLKLTPEQRRRFDEDGFFLVEDVLSESEVETLLVAVDEFDEHYRRERDLEPHDPFQMRNIVAHHECFLRMMDHAAMLPLIVDVMGYNIQLRTSHLDVRPPQQPEALAHSLGAKEGFFPWHSDRPDYELARCRWCRPLHGK